MVRHTESEWKSPLSSLVKFNFLTLNVNMQKYQGFVYFKNTWKKECSKERRGKERRGKEKDVLWIDLNSLQVMQYKVFLAILV